MDLDKMSLGSRGNMSGFITVMMWSASGLLLALTGNIPAFQLALITLVFPFVVTAGKWIVTKEDCIKHFRQPWYLYVLGVFGVGGYTVFWYLGFKYAPPFEANLINYMWPFLILVFAAFILKEKMNFTQIVGTLVSFAGLGIIFYKGGVVESFESDHILGYMFALIGAVIWALYSVLTKLTKGFSSDVISICCLISGLPILIMHLCFEEFVMPQGVEWLGVIGLMITRVSYLFWSFAMRHGDIGVVVGVSYFTPLLSSIFLIIFEYAQHVGISALLIIFGSILISWKYITSAVSPEFVDAKDR